MPVGNSWTSGPSSKVMSAKGSGRGRRRGRGRRNSSPGGRGRTARGSSAGGGGPRPDSSRMALAGSLAGISTALGDKESPFLRPRPRRVQPVPLEFQSTTEWCSIMAHNLLAEFWHVFREGSSGSAMRGRSLGEKSLLLQGDTPGNQDEGMAQHLLLIGRSLHLVTNSKPDEGASGGSVLSVRPVLQQLGQLQVRDLGYIGSYVAELGALIELSGQHTAHAARSSALSRSNPVLASILCPRHDLPVRSPCSSTTYPHN